MEKRDYIEREIEKMRAVIQKILRLRVDRPQEAQALAQTEIVKNFQYAPDDLVNMTDATFEAFIEAMLPSMLDFLGNLMYASVDSTHKLTRGDLILLRRTIITWDLWESKTQTADWEKIIRKDEINRLLSEY